MASNLINPALSRQTTLALALLMVSLLFLGGCPPAHTGKDSLSNNPETLVQGGRYQEALTVLDSILSGDKDQARLDRYYYLRGLCYRKLYPAQSAKAAADFTQALQITHTPEILQLGNTALAHTCFESSPPDYFKAIVHYKAALNGMAARDPKDAVLYRLGLSLQYTGQFELADAVYEQCLKEFPDSTYAESCRANAKARAFSLQYGVFSTVDRANAMMLSLNQEAIIAKWTQVSKNGKVLYAVRSGRYSTQSQAQSGLAAIKAKRPDVIIVAVP